MSDEFQGMSAAGEVEDHDWNEPPKWPKVVGIISIVWGSIGVLCNGLGLVGTVLTPQMMQMAAQEMEGGMPPQVTQPNMWYAVMGVLSILMSIGLILAGIFTVNRKPAGRTFHLAVAVGTLILVAISLPLQWANMTAIGEWVANNPDAEFSQNYTPMGSMVGMAVSVVLAGGWPIFLLIWFGALGKRPEVDAPEVL